MRAGVWILFVVLMAAVESDAKKMAWTFTDANVVWSDAEVGEYVLRWEFPGRLVGMRIEYATLELRMDSSPWVETRMPYAVTISRLDDFSRGDGRYVLAGEEPATAVAVSTGADRVVLDVTRLLRSWRAIDGAVFALVSSGGASEVVPTLRSGAIAPGAVARLTVYSVER